MGLALREVWHHLQGHSQSNQGNEDDESGTEPVDVLIPVLHGHGLLGDVRFFKIVLGAPERLVLGGSIRECRSLQGGCRRRGHDGRGWVALMMVDGSNNNRSVRPECVELEGEN